MTERVEQKICIKFCVKLGHSSLETSRMTQKATAMGNWWLAASSQQCLYIMSRTEFFCETSNHPGDSAPLQPRCGVLQLLAFPKTKITFERDEISDCQWDSGKYDGAADGDSSKDFCSVLNSGRDAGRTLWSHKAPTFKGTEASLSYVQCFLYLVSFSINVSIFHSTWLDTFWTDLIHIGKTLYIEGPELSEVSGTHWGPRIYLLRIRGDCCILLLWK